MLAHHARHEPESCHPFLLQVRKGSPRRRQPGGSSAESVGDVCCSIGPMRAQDAPDKELRAQEGMCNITSSMQSRARQPQCQCQIHPVQHGSPLPKQPPLEIQRAVCELRALMIQHYVLLRLEFLQSHSHTSLSSSRAATVTTEEPSRHSELTGWEG